MITVYEVCAKYAANNNLPPFGHHKLANIGSFISTHFKKFWAPFQSDEIIAQAGFVRTIEEGKTYIVCGYPDCFEPEMIARITVFLEMKRVEQLDRSIAVAKKQLGEKKDQKLPAVVKEQIASDVKEIRKRKRIPIKS